MLALGRFEGVAADRWVSVAWRHHRSPRRLVPAPDGVPAAPAFLGADPGPSPAALRLPVAGVSADGIVDLGADGLAVICRASAVTFSLRTPVEQEALVAGFARWLNSLAQPAQILVRAEPVDLAPSIDALLEAAPGLPHPALEAAARDHAAFLADLARARDLLRREVLVVLRQPSRPTAPQPTPRRGCSVGPAKPAGALGAAGVTLVRPRRAGGGHVPGPCSRPGRRTPSPPASTAAVSANWASRSPWPGARARRVHRRPRHERRRSMTTFLSRIPRPSVRAGIAVRSRRHRGPSPGAAGRRRLVRQLRRHRLPARGGPRLARAADRPPRPPRRRRARRARPGQHRRRPSAPPAGPPRIGPAGRCRQGSPGRPRRRGGGRGRPRPGRRAWPAASRSCSGSGST